MDMASGNLQPVRRRAERRTAPPEGDWCSVDDWMTPPGDPATPEQLEDFIRDMRKAVQERRNAEGG